MTTKAVIMVQFLERVIRLIIAEVPEKKIIDVGVFRVFKDQDELCVPANWEDYNGMMARGLGVVRQPSLNEKAKQIAARHIYIKANPHHRWGFVCVQAFACLAASM